MKPSDVTLLVVLGTADSGPASLEELVEAARLLAPQDWKPTAETIRLCSEQAVVDGLLQAVPGDRATGSVLRATAAGRAAILDLLRQPIDESCGGLTGACMSAKVWFLHHLPVAERGRSSQCLSLLYQLAIKQLRRIDRSWLPTPESATAAFRHEVMRMESELYWIDVMRRACSGSGLSGAASRFQDDAS